MSRPKKVGSEKLSTTLPPIRCTITEKALIYARSKKAEMSLSEYLRQMALKGEINIRQSATDFEAVQQLRKIGINLNQQTKKFHQTGFMPYELKALWPKLEALLTEMMKD